MTRSEHLVWCKSKALDALKLDNPEDVWSSFVSDMGKHPDTAGHMAISLGMGLLITGNLSEKDKMQKFIEDFG